MSQRSSKNFNTKHTMTLAWAEEMRRNFTRAVLLLVTFIIVSASSYCIVEGWKFRDALYMTVITFSTVGYREVHPLSPAGQILSMILIIIGMCLVAYCFGIIGQTLIAGEINRYRGLHKMRKKIAGYKDHIIIAGFGRLARAVIPELLKRNYNIVIIESDPLKIIDLEAHQLPYLEGNAHDEECLRYAGVERAKALLAVVPNDADNVYITLAARNMNKNLWIVSRIEAIENKNKLLIAGANQVFCPYQLSGDRVLHQLLHQQVNECMPIFTNQEYGDQLVLKQLQIGKSSEVAGKTLQESNLRTRTGVTVAACIAKDGQVQPSPSGNQVLEAETSIIVIGTGDSLVACAQLLSATNEGFRSEENVQQTPPSH
ncbi:MAG: potassium channel protein [Bdellovibrionales bacterium]|nr:potassium channel protein [Bdellovibrionales bacterium]